MQVARLGLARLCAVHGDEGRAEAVDAGEVLVARGLVDLALAPELGFERLHGNAVRLHAAIAAAFADELVDDDALIRVGERSALAAPAFFRRAGLVVEEDRRSLDFREIALHLVEVFARMNRQACGPVRAGGIFVGLVGDERDFLHALGGDLPRDHVDGQAALVALAAGHGDGVVEQDLVSDVGLSVDRPADRQHAGMIVGAVAEILEDVLALREGRLADPVRAFAAHVGEALGRAVHPLRHEMAADAGIGAHALRHAGGGVVRAARAEIGNAESRILGVGQHGLRLLQRPQLLLDLGIGLEAQDALGDGDGDLVGVERALHGEEPVVLLILLADDDRRIGRAEQFLADLHFDQRALLLDDDDHVEAFGEVLQALRLDRPDATELVETDAEVVGLDLVDAEIVEGLAHVEIGLAGRDDSDLRRRPARSDDAVDLVGAEEGEDRVALVFLQARFLIENAVARTNGKAADGHLEVGGRDDFDAVDRAVDGGRRLDRVLQALDADPYARVARQRETVDAVVEDFLHAGRRHDRHHDVDEMEVGLVRCGGGFSRMVVAHQDERAAVLRRAGEIGVAEDVAGAVDARTLAVPDAEDAVVLAFAAHLGLLRAPDGGGGEILVEAGLEEDVVPVEQLLGRMHLHVDAAERGAAIAGDEASRVDAGAAVALLLHQQQAHDRLRAGREDALFRQIELVVERDAGRRNALGCSDRVGGTFKGFAHFSSGPAHRRPKPCADMLACFDFGICQ